MAAPEPDFPTPDSHPAALPVDSLAAQCDLAFTRRSGPGGQNRNKVETAVVVTHRPTGLRAEASERRTQGENREAALHRLRLRLALEIRSARSAPIEPSALWRSRCRAGRIEVNDQHADFPALLAEALDALHVLDLDPQRAAAVLGCSATQLVKLLRKEPRALKLVNDQRTAAGLHPLR